MTKLKNPIKKNFLILFIILNIIELHLVLRRGKI